MQERSLVFLLVALIALVAVAPANAAVAKKGKVHVCVAKKGQDKGAMRYVRANKCHKGEKSLSWNKKGPAGAPGAAGATGPAGDGASPDAIAALQQQLAAQAAQIAALQSQLAAACTQLTTVTTQLNALGTALDGIGLGGTIPPLLTLITPGAPSPLPAFSCPAA